MITSGKSDERQINSNKIQIFMYLKRKMYLASAVHLACLGPTFLVFLILFFIYKLFICLDEFFCFISWS